MSPSFNFLLILNSLMLFQYIRIFYIGQLSKLAVEKEVTKINIKKAPITFKLFLIQITDIHHLKRKI